MSTKKMTKDEYIEWECRGESLQYILDPSN
jgi:hypothetical protein